jgi:GH43 family beta-xylosidase
MIRLRVVVVLAVAMAALLLPVNAHAAGTFTNPITHSDDPAIIQYGGFYYFTGTDGCDAGFICVWKSATITGLNSATKVDIYRIPGCPAPNCVQVWAPQIVNVNGTFYVYYTAADSDAAGNHRIFVLQDTSADPVGPYVEGATGLAHGQLYESHDAWAIDPDVFQVSTGALYVTFSAIGSNGHQDIFIAPMSDPLHTNGSSVQISTSDRPWEVVGNPVQEGPVGFQHGGRTYITYSGSSCATSSYAVGLLTNTDGNLLNPGSWTKTGPIFKYHSGVVGTASFVNIQTINGSEDWFLYHSSPTGQCGPERVIDAQRLYWDARDGSPLLGYPISSSVPITAPQGELGSTGSPDPFNQGWGDAFGDLAEGVNDGRQYGSWTVNSPTGAGLASFGGTAWTRLFQAGNPNYETYTVSADLQWVATGSTSSYPKYGIYASYDDRNNWVSAWIDRKYMVLATYAVVQGAAQNWQNAPLPAGFDPTQYHTLSVRKTGATYTFYLDGVQLQQRTFPGTFPVLLNGQAGLLTEDTQANYRNVTISNTQ